MLVDIINMHKIIFKYIIIELKWLNLILIYLQGNILDRDYLVLDFLFSHLSNGIFFTIMQIMTKRSNTNTREREREWK